MNKYFHFLSEKKSILYPVSLFVFFLLIFFVNDIKSLLLVTASLLFFTVVTLKANVLQVLYVSCLNIIWLEKGIRGTNLLIVAQGSEDWAHSYSLYIGLSLKFVLIVCMAILIVVGRRKIITEPNKLLMMLLFFLGVASVLMAPDYLLAYSGIIRLFSGIVLFFVSLQLLKDTSFRKLVVITLLSLFAFQAIVGSYQVLSSNQLPIYLNDAYGLRQNGYFTSDGPSIFRATGLVGHPTYFGALMALLLPFVLWKLIERVKISKNKLTAYNVLVLIALILVFTLGSIAIYGSFSRSAWVISAITSLVFLWLETKNKSLKFKKIVLCIFVTSALLFLAFIPNSRERIATIPNFISGGSGKVRVQLIQESFVIISQHPLFGVGPNHFVRAMSQRDLIPELRGFMFPVHNTFLLFASEMGMPMAIVFITIISMSLMKLRSSHNQNNSLERITILTAIVSFIISSQFHALYNQDPTFELFFILLAWSYTV